jgi:tellurite methyltransferase
MAGTNRGDYQIPDSARPGRRTPTFDHTSVPPALLREHRTTTWAELVVVAGSVTFHDALDGWTAVASPDSSVVIVPDRPHHIDPDEAAEFYVQFYDAA